MQYAPTGWPSTKKHTHKKKEFHEETPFSSSSGSGWGGKPSRSL
jgi:hypothetical protein